jgi:membrane protein implicated in regulation of membrane protease activity
MQIIGTGKAVGQKRDGCDRIWAKLRSLQKYMGIIPYLWFVAGAVFIIAELFTPGFVLLWFGIGAIIAGILGLLQLGLGIQMIAFIVISTALTIASRTIFEKFFMRGSDGKSLKTGIESLPGQVGVVVEGSRGALNEAAVKVYGSVWTAYPVPREQLLNVGDEVEVDRVEGAVLYVRRPPAALPWRETR